MCIYILLDRFLYCCLNNVSFWTWILINCIHFLMGWIIFFCRFLFKCKLGYLQVFWAKLIAPFYEGQRFCLLGGCLTTGLIVVFIFFKLSFLSLFYLYLYHIPVFFSRDDNMFVVQFMKRNYASFWPRLNSVVDDFSFSCNTTTSTMLIIVLTHYYTFFRWCFF